MLQRKHLTADFLPIVALMMPVDYSSPSLPIFMTIAPEEISDMLCPPCYANPSIVLLRVMKMLMMQGDYPLNLSCEHYRESSY